jgi:hypothetical protein
VVLLVLIGTLVARAAAFHAVVELSFRRDGQYRSPFMSLALEVIELISADCALVGLPSPRVKYPYVD